MSSSASEGSGYIETEWENGVTPISDDNLNKIEHGIAANSNDITLINTELASLDTRLDTLEYNFQYNETPVKTGRKINGKDEYIYGMEISSLPNSSSATYTTSILLSNIEIVTEVGGTGVREGVTWFNFNGNRITTNLEIELSTGNNNGYLTFVLATGYDRRDVKGYVYFKFTYKN